MKQEKKYTMITGGGDDMVVSGLMNKINIAMSNVLPDHMVANTMKKKQ